MKQLSLFLFFLTLMSLACTQVVVTPTPTAQPSPTLPALTIAPLETAQPTATAEQTAVVLQPRVYIHVTAGGAVLKDKYLVAVDTVTLGERVGDWQRITSPVDGWVFVGCLDLDSGKRCEAAE